MFSNTKWSHVGEPGTYELLLGTVAKMVEEKGHKLTRHKQAEITRTWGIASKNKAGPSR